MMGCRFSLSFIPYLQLFSSIIRRRCCFPSSPSTSKHFLSTDPTQTVTTIAIKCDTGPRYPKSLLVAPDAQVNAETERERTQRVDRGYTASIKCLVEEEPAEDVTWSWVRKRVDCTVEELPDEDVRVDGFSSNLIVTPITPKDYGRFLCSAANSVGRQREVWVVTLVPERPPDTPSN